MRALKAPSNLCWPKCKEATRIFWRSTAVCQLVLTLAHWNSAGWWKMSPRSVKPLLRTDAYLVPWTLGSFGTWLVALRGACILPMWRMLHALCSWILSRSTGTLIFASMQSDLMKSIYFLLQIIFDSIDSLTYRHRYFPKFVARLRFTVSSLPLPSLEHPYPV